MDKKKVLVSWSGGKDSTLVLQELLKDDRYEVTGLLTNFTEEDRKVTMHYVPEDIIQKQADALQLPLFRVLIPKGADNKTFRERTKKAVENEEVDALAFGDIFLEDIRKFREDLCDEMGVEAVFPLWDKKPGQIAEEFLDAGFSAIVVCLESKNMKEDMLGHVYNHDLIQDLPQGTDEAGEQGHFHTLVIDGPVFQQGIEVVITGKKVAEMKGADMNKFLYCTFKV